MPYRQYTTQDIENALKAVREGLSLRGAAKKYNIPFTTLQSKHSGKYPVKTRSGPSPIFTEEEEQELVNYILRLSQQGFPITKDQLLDTVQDLVTKLEKKTPFVNNRPSRHWYEAFLRRNDELKEKMSQNLTKRRSNVNESDIRNWFLTTAEYLKSKNLVNIDPRRRFNLDESSFLLAPTGVEVLVHKQDKAAYG